MAEPLQHEQTNDSKEQLRDRLAFYGLDETARQALRSIKPIVDRELPRALEKFYVLALATPQTRAFFADAALLERARGAQIEHWKRLSNGEWEGRSFEQARRVGETHARIGLSPKWYAAAYGAIAEHLVTSVVTEMWPKGALRGGAFAKGGDAGVALSALTRVVLLDLEIATSSYIEALDVKRSAAEAASAAAAREGAQAIEACRAAFNKLAARNLGAGVAVDLAPRFQEMIGEYNRAVGGVREALASVAESIDSIATATREIADASQNLSSRTEHEASSIEQSSAAIEEVSSQVSRTAEGAQAAQSIVTAAHDEAQQSNAIVSQAIAAMQRIEKSSSDIGKIIGAIDEIAFQTNLLALNAGVEAARAGDAGKGFAVVASEVRGLAQRSAEAAKEIKALVAAATTEVAGGVKLVSETGQALGRIAGKVGEMNGVVGEILASARQQSASLGEIKQAVGELSVSTQQNAAMAEQSTAASQSLARETEALTMLVGQFDLGRGVRSSRATPPAPRAVAAAAPRPARAAAAPARSLRVANGAEADWKEF